MSQVAVTLVSWVGMWPEEQGKQSGWEAMIWEPAFLSSFGFLIMEIGFLFSEEHLWAGLHFWVLSHEPCGPELPTFKREKELMVLLGECGLALKGFRQRLASILFRNVRGTPLPG